MEIYIEDYPEEIIEFLYDHPQAWEDCCNHYGVDPDNENALDEINVTDWIYDHDQLCADLYSYLEHIAIDNQIAMSDYYKDYLSDMSLSEALKMALHEDDNGTEKYKLVYEPYERYISSGLKTVTFKASSFYEALLKIVDKLMLYITVEQIKEDNMNEDEIMNSIEMSNGDGCDYIVRFENLSNGTVYMDYYYEEDEWDDDEEDEPIDRNEEAEYKASITDDVIREAIKFAIQKGISPSAGAILTCCNIVLKDINPDTPPLFRSFEFNLDDVKERIQRILDEDR